MSHPHGTYLGGVRCLETLRERCVIDGDCWHFRTARGRIVPHGRPPTVWLVGSGSVVAARAAIVLSGRTWLAGGIVVHSCGSQDCVQPRHVRQVERGSWLRDRAKGGYAKSARKTAANRVEGLRRSRVSAELRAWIAESPQPAKEVAHAVGVSPSWVAALRVKARALRWGAV